MITITQTDIGDITGMDDNRSWTFCVQQMRESDSGTGIITPKKDRKYPIEGVLTVELDPGPAVVLAPDGKTYPFTVPDTDSDLWSLIQAAVTIPPSTTHQKLLDAVDAWLDRNADIVRPITPEQFGAVGDGSTNDAAPLNECFAAAAGKTIWLDPSKTYAHNSLITIGQDGTTVTGGGTLKATNSSSEQSCVLVTGDNVTIDHVTLTCPTASVRRFTGNDCKLQVLTCDGAVIRHVTINGSSNFGFLAQGATNFYVESCLAENTMADGFQSSFGSTNGQFVNCSTVDTGDDGFSVISYAADPTITSNITNRGFSVKNSSARGISVVGGTNVRYFDGKIDNTTAAAIYIACELPTNPSYGVSNVVVSNVDVANANSGAPGTITGAVMVFNSRNSPYSVDTTSITDIRLRDTDVDAARQISIQNLGTGTLTGLELGPMVFSGTVPAAVLFTSGVSATDYTNNLNTPSLPSKTTPVDADLFVGADSAASNKPAKFTWANIKATMVAAIVGAAPSTMDTLDEIAAALGDDANYAATITTVLGTKAPLASPAFTGTPTGITKSHVGLGNVDNTSNATERAAAATLTNKTLDNPRISNVLDTNGNIMLALGVAGSAVNNLQITNAGSGGSPAISALGESADIGIVVVPKGDGAVILYGSSGQTMMNIVAGGSASDIGIDLLPKGAGLALAGGNPISTKVGVPSTSSSTGKDGWWAADSSWLYICTATNTWKRVAIATW